MKITVSGREYEVLKVYKKEHPLQDLFLCRAIPYKYKVCFTRFQIECQEPVKNHNGRPLWTETEDEYINKQLESGKTPEEVVRDFNISYRTEVSITNRVHKLHKKLVNA